MGINEESINNTFAKLLMRVNGERPATQRHNANVETEKLLECTANALQHFSELAMKEIDAMGRQTVLPEALDNALVNWINQRASGTSLPSVQGQRDFCCKYADKEAEMSEK